MNERLSLLTVLVLLGGAVVASMLWLSGDVESLHPTAASDQPLTAVAAGPADPHTAVVEASTPASAAVMRDAAAAGAATPVPLPEDASWIAITVVDKATGTPVPGATVHWFDYEIAQRLAQDAPLSQQQRSIVENDAELWAEQYGWHTTTDSLGVARVAIGDAATVVARCETRYGTLELQRNTIAPREGHRLLLAADAEVLVQVLDDRGAPAADVMITLAVYASNGDFEHMWNWAPIAATAAPDGIAHVRHLQTIASSRDAPADKQWRVRTVLPGFPDPGVSLSITEPPAEPIVLRLPPCGRVRARAEFAGQPMYGLKSAYLDDAQDQEREEQGFAIERLADADGWVRFPRVPLGRRYLAVTDSIGTLRANFAGPLTADQEVVVVLTPDRNDILLRGRIVDEERHPVAAQRFQAQARGSQFRSSSVFATDASGNFLVLLGPARANNRVDQLGFVPLGRDGGQMQKRADAPPRELRIGVEDLGDLVLNGGALLAAGHFRSGGLPHQKRVSIWIERRDTTTGKSERWRRQQGVMYNQTEDRFEVRGGVPPGTYRLGFQAEGCLPIDPVPFTVGATDLLVDIGIGHALAASVLLPEHTPETDLTAVLVRSEPAGVVTTAHASAGRGPVAHPWGGEGGRFNLQWNALPAGSYALELRLWTHASPLHTVPDLQVPPPPGGDPRLVDVDLRSLVRVLRLELLDADGKPLENVDGVVFPAGQNPQAEWLGYRIDDASSKLLVKPGPIEFIVAVEGHRPTPALATGDLLQVRLDAWPTIALTIADVPALPAKVRLFASFEPTEKSELAWRSQADSGNRHDLLHSRRSVTVADGKADVPIGDGPHTLRLRLQGNRRAIALELPARQFLSTDGQARVVVPPEQWPKALEMMKQPPK
jgi:hypothetical protein